MIRYDKIIETLLIKIHLLISNYLKHENYSNSKRSQSNTHNT